MRGDHAHGSPKGECFCRLSRSIVLAVGLLGAVLLIQCVALASPADAAWTFNRSIGVLGQPGQFKAPRDIAISPTNGDLYIADSRNHRIQRMSTAGAFVAQYGSSGSGNGQFSYPSGITFLADGTFWVADSGNNRLQHLSATGTYLGQFGSAGVGNGQFDTPLDIAVAGDGTLWVTDALHSRVQHFSAAGAYVGQFGSGGTANGQFTVASAIAIASDGSIYVSDRDGVVERIQKFNSSGTYQLQFAVPFDYYGLDVAPDGAVWVSTQWSGELRRYTSAGALTTTVSNWGGRTGGWIGAAGIDVASDGSVWVIDDLADRVQHVTSAGALLSRFGTSGAGQLAEPGGVAVTSDGTTYVVDIGNQRVQVFDSSGAPNSTIGSDGVGNGQFTEPYGVAVAADGSLWVTDSVGDRVQHFSAAGAYLGQFGSYGSANGQFDYAAGIAVASDGTLWVADTSNNRVQHFSAAGAYLGKFGTAGTGNGQFDGPLGVAIAGDGSLWVVDSNNDRVEHIASNGTYLGQFGTNGAGNGQFSRPRDVAIGSTGLIYVSDQVNARVQAFSSAGVYRSQLGFVDLDGSSTGFINPAGLAVTTGTLYVTDSELDRVTAWNESNAPASPTVLVQKQSDNATVIAGGSITADGAGTNVFLNFSVSDPDAAQTLTPRVEVRPNGTGFSSWCGEQTSGVTFAGTPVAAATGGTSYAASVTVTGLTSGVTYHWRACATDQDGTAGTWTPKGGNPDFGVDTTPPPAVTTLAATWSGTTSVDLTWTTVVDTGGGTTSYYRVYRSPAGCSSWTQISTNGSPSAGTYADSTLVADTVYCYKVQAVDSVGNEKTTGATSVTVLPGPTTLFTHDTNAQAGGSQPTTITSGTPHFSTVNVAGAAVTKQQTRVYNDIVDPTVLGLWHLDTATGHLTDSSTFGDAPLTATGSGVVAGTTGFGQASDSAAEYLVSPTRARFNRANDFTVSAWFATSSAPATSAIIVQKANNGCGVAGCNFSLELHADSAFTVHASNGGASYSAAVAGAQYLDGRWHQVLATVSSGNLMTLYIDGVPRDAQALPGGADTTSYPVSVGAASGALYRFNGSIDEVEYVARELSPPEILGAFQTHLPHGTPMWDSDPSNTGTAIASCNSGSRCADVVYGATGTPRSLSQGRFFTTQRLWSAGTWSNWSAPDWFEIAPTLSVSAPGSVPLGTLVPGTDLTGTLPVTVVSNSATGYQLTATDSSNTTAMTAGAASIADASGPCAAPTSWTAGAAGGMGYTVLSATGGTSARLGKWGTGTGTAANDFVNNLYCGLQSSTSALVHERTTPYIGTDTVTLGLRANVASATSGTYTGTVTLTVLAIV